MLDADLAELYGVSTKRLNEQVKRNRRRFPPEFTFQLTQNEKDEVVAKCDLKAGQGNHKDGTPKKVRCSGYETGHI